MVHTDHTCGLKFGTKVEIMYDFTLNEIRSIVPYDQNRCLETANPPEDTEEIDFPSDGGGEALLPIEDVESEEWETFLHNALELDLDYEVGGEEALRP